MFGCSIQQKWIISILGMYSCGLMYCIRAGLGIAMVRMTVNNNRNNNNSTITNAPIFDWNETTQGIVLGGIFYLYWIVPTLVGTIVDRFNTKYLALIGVIGPCVCTAITPWIATVNVYLLVINMILMGATQGFIYPSLFHIYIRWFSPEELSRANSGMQVGQSIGGTLIYLIGGYLCETSIGWPLIFYVQAAAHIPWIVLWLRYGQECPDGFGDTKSMKKNKSKTPWLAILKSGVVWSSILSKLSCSYGFYMFLSKMPAYLSQRHQISIVTNGFICAAAFGSYGLMCFIAPYLSNHMINRRNFDKIIVRKLFQAIAMIVPGVCLFTITMIDDKIIIITMIIMAMFCYGFFTGGEWTIISEYAPNFVGIVSGLTHILGFITGFMAPYIVGIILDSSIGDEHFKWNFAFWISSLLYLVGYVAFHLLASVQQQPWDIV